MRMSQAMKLDTVYNMTLQIDSYGGLIEKEIKVKINFNVHPEEKQTLIDPGYPAFTEINEAIFVDATTGEEIELPEWIKNSVLYSDGMKEWLLSDAWEQYEIMLDEAADNSREDY